jgi:hypothetical protein
MIVFAVHNMVDKIELVLEQLNKFNKIDVLIVDTNSPTDVVKWFFEEKKDSYNFKLIYDKLDVTGYETGAFLHAFKNYKADKFYFFQDSIEFINTDIFNKIDSLLEIYNVVSISHFPLIFDNTEQLNWVISSFDKNEISNLKYTPFGIFGSMFSIKRKDLEKIPSKWLNYPTNKLETCGMERKWAIIFAIIGLSVVYLEEDHMIFLQNNNNKYINKFLIGRQ